MKQDAHWASINEFTFLAGMRALFWVCRVLGRWPFRVILYPILFWYVLTKPTARQASRKYLQHVAHSKEIDTGVLMIVRHFAAFAEMMLDKMLLWSGDFDAGQVHYFGTDVMGEMIRSKRGAVLMCSHFGNVELCRVLSARHRELKMTILVHTKHAQMFNHLLATINPASQMNLLQVTEINPATAIMLSERIAQGELVVIAGDRIPVSSNPRTIATDFLGESAPFPVGPYILASVLQCPLFMVFSMKKAAYEVHFSLLRQSIRLPRNGRDAAIQELIHDYAASLQEHCLSAPLQWFNFYDYWNLPKMDKY